LVSYNRKPTYSGGDKAKSTTLTKNSKQVMAIMFIIIYMKKLLDSDWLRAVQFRCNTSAKSVTPVQITHPNSGL